MTEQKQNQKADEIVRKSEETALLTYFRSFGTLDRVLLLMEAEGMAKALTTANQKD